MAGAESSEKPVFSLRLLVDKNKNKVVLAEVGKDFVNVLFSFLTLPMGTIVRLLEKYQQDQKSQAATIGCFNNLYKSVSGLGTASCFMTEACKHMLLYPRSMKENQCRRLKLNIDDTEVLKYYTCPNSVWKDSCRKAYSNYCSSRCYCGLLMEVVLKCQDLAHEDIFVSEKTSFTITDNMKVGFNSMGLTLKTLKGLGYVDVDQLHEMLVDVDHEKVLALLQCVLFSDTPLTDVFLKKRISCATTKMHNMQSLALQEANGGEAKSKKVIPVSVFTRKVDRKVLYVESGKDFVDLLFTLLVLPLNSAREISGSNIALGCISNLYESFKSLSSSYCGNTLTGKCMLPWYYRCQQPLLDVCYEWGCTKKINYSHNCELKPMDPRGDKLVENELFSGFVKRGLTFMISDDLIISPINLSSTICSLKKVNMDLDDIEEQVINISETEAIKLLRASLMTSTVLNTVFGCLLPKIPKEEKL